MKNMVKNIRTMNKLWENSIKILKNLCKIQEKINHLIKLGKISIQLFYSKYRENGKKYANPDKNAKKTSK